MAAEAQVGSEPSEPTFADALRELKCLLRWGLRRWPVAILLSLLAAFGVGYKLYKRAPSYLSTVVIDVKTNNVFSDGPPPSTRELTKYIMGIALADTYLVELAEKLGYDLGPTMGGKPVDLYLFRDAIRLSVYYDTPPNTMYTHTRIGLRFSGGSPETALNGARLLAEHVVSFQNRNRLKGLEMEREVALETELGIAQRVKEREAELARVTLEQSTVGAGSDYSARLMALQNEVAQLRELQETITRRTSQSLLRGDFERDASGLGYEIVDRGHLAPPKRFSQMDIALIAGLFVWLAAFPVFVLALGALSFRVYDQDSLRRLGLAYFGQGYVATPGLQSMVERQRVISRGSRG